MHILLVLDQRAMQRRHDLVRVLAVERLGRNVFSHQQLQPVDQFRGGRFFLQARDFADFEKGIQRIGAEQELCIVNRYFRPSFNALEILDKINDPHFTTELGLFNIEANLEKCKTLIRI